MPVATVSLLYKGTAEQDVPTISLGISLEATGLTARSHNYL
jgi:hypothetical protein